ncbi:hypothetical protein [Sporosarcina sp. FA9]|uniref:hypothetical protein n=1 Tax=Sporosarcina sp. FA9 TaxID=3413030 RepID=UPI003F65C3A4
MSDTTMYMIGSISVPSSWIALAVAFVIAFGVVRIRSGKLPADVFSDALFYFIIVWKLSVILTNFETVIKSPLSIIYFNGGIVGFYLGLAVAGVRIVFEIRKNYSVERLVALFVGAVTVQVVYQILMVAMNPDDWIVNLVTIGLFLGFGVLVWINVHKSRSWAIQLTVLWIAVHVFVAAFQEDGITATPVIATACIGVFFAICLNFKRESEEKL